MDDNGERDDKVVENDVPESQTDIPDAKRRRLIRRIAGAAVVAPVVILLADGKPNRAYAS
jgi:hypothetical protein